MTVPSCNSLELKVVLSVGTGEAVSRNLRDRNLVLNGRYSVTKSSSVQYFSVPNKAKGQISAYLETNIRINVLQEHCVDAIE